MALSLKLQTRVVMISLTLMIAAVGVKAQSGISSVYGSVADFAATKQGKFVVVTGANVELEQNTRNTPRKFTTTTDKRGVFSFQQIPYGDYVLRVSATNYRSYELKFFVESDDTEDISVLLEKRPN